MNAVLIRRELVRALRGPRTQGQVSRKLGYRTNQLYRWEAGLQTLRWKDFVQLCRVCRVDLKGACRDLLKYEGNPANSRQLVAHFVGQAKVAPFAAKSGVSRFKVSRWLSGGSEPTLDDVLELIEKHQRGLFDFVFQLTGTKGVPSFKREAEAKRRYSALLKEHPWCGIARMCLDLDAYQRLERHEPGYLARRLRISRESEESLLARLVDADVLRWEKGKLLLNELGINVRGDPALEARIIRYWVEQAADVYDRTGGKEGSRFHIVTFSASQEAVRQIEDEVRELYAKIRSILGADSPKTDQVRVFCLQLLDLDDLKFDI